METKGMSTVSFRSARHGGKRSAPTQPVPPELGIPIRKLWPREKPRLREQPPPPLAHVVWSLAPHFAGRARGEVHSVYKVHMVAIIPRGLSRHPLVFPPKQGILAARVLLSSGRAQTKKAVGAG